ncbi:PEP-CTERM sorting domain-containing protein [Paracoccus fontiphilus]|uniref:PEP-CTERM sorting domain-containing protein n=1 Tax=Paracoccus fontiphilus TaxID=1815556 RepID=UPI0036732B24
MGVKAMVAAALLAVGIGSAADAATIVGWRNVFGTSHPVYREAFDVDLYFDRGYVDGENNSIDSWGIYTKDTPVIMRIVMDWFSPDYWADISMSSRGQDWDVSGSLMLMGDGFIASGKSPEGTDFELRFSPFGGSANHLEFRPYGSAQHALTYLSVENIRLAPVPLPATAALLSLGIGALAVMRKRRRAIS